MDRLHARLRASIPLQRFTLLVRTLLAVGFIAPGLTKVFGLDFAPGLDPASPMGIYFQALHQTGVYYAFIGVAQVIAGALLLSRRTALLGALLYAPIIANIAVLTAATRFGAGTTLVTALMALGCLWLLVWDAHRLAGIVSASRTLPAERDREPAAWDVLARLGARPVSRLASRAAYVLGAAGALAFTLAARALVPAEALLPSMVLIAASVPLAAVGWIAGGRRASVVA